MVTSPRLPTCPVLSALSSLSQDKAPAVTEQRRRRDRGTGKVAQRNSSPEAHWPAASKEADLLCLPAPRPPPSLPSSHPGRVLAGEQPLERTRTASCRWQQCPTCLTGGAEPRTEEGGGREVGEWLGSGAVRPRAEQSCAAERCEGRGRPGAAGGSAGRGRPRPAGPGVMGRGDRAAPLRGPPGWGSQAAQT